MKSDLCHSTGYSHRWRIYDNSTWSENITGDFGPRMSRYLKTRCSHCRRIQWLPIHKPIP